MAQKQKTNITTLDIIASEIRVELRSIIRTRRELYAPLERLGMSRLLLKRGLTFYTA